MDAKDQKKLTATELAKPVSEADTSHSSSYLSLRAEADRNNFSDFNLEDSGSDSDSGSESEPNFSDFLSSSGSDSGSDYSSDDDVCVCTDFNLETVPLTDSSARILLESRVPWRDRTRAEQIATMGTVPRQRLARDAALLATLEAEEAKVRWAAAEQEAEEKAAAEQERMISERMEEITARLRSGSPQKESMFECGWVRCEECLKIIKELITENVNLNA